MKSVLRLLYVALFFFFTSTVASSQSITINLNNYISYCAGSTIDVPVTLTGNFGNNNVYKLKLLKHYYGIPDTTIIVESINKAFPLRFQIPKLYVDYQYASNTIFSISIESTSPITVSNSIYAIIQNLPQIKLLVPVNNSYWYSVYEKDEYMNPKAVKYLAYSAYPGIEDGSTKFKLNDSTTHWANSSLLINPSNTFTYSVARVWNTCGTGKILGQNSVIVKVNPFKIKNASVVPNVICEDKKVRIKFDYVGKFNPDNRFLIDLSNKAGDTITTLSTIKEDSSNVYATLPDGLNVDNYRVRVRGTSPDAATNYYEISILPNPSVEILWFKPYPEPIDNNYPIPLRINVLNTLEPIYLRFSDGSIIKHFEGFGGSRNGYSADIKLNLKSNFLYKIDSIVTKCGILRNIPILGEKSWNLKTDFNIETLPKHEYCEGEQIKLKIKSTYLFGQNNIFTFNLYDPYKTLLISVPITVMGDSLWATIPDTQYLQGQTSGFTFTISASNPQVTSTYNNDNFIIHRKPSFNLYYPSTTLTTPNYVGIAGLVTGIAPLYLTLNDGISDKDYKLLNSNSDFGRDAYLQLFAIKPINYSIKNIKNICGNTVINPKQIHSVTISQPFQKYMYFTNNNDLLNMCERATYDIKFDTIGQFSANNQFIVTFKPNGTDSEIELGRGNHSPIQITIPNNLPFTNSQNLIGTINLSSTTFTPPLQSNVQMVFSSTLIKSHKVNFESILLNNHLFGTSQLPSDKRVETLQGDNVKIQLASSQPTFYKYKINGKWFSLQPTYYGYETPIIDINVQKDTILYLQEIIGTCGVVSMKDTFEIKVKKYRFKSIIHTLNLCQGDEVEVFFGIEGNLNNRPIDFKMYLSYDNQLHEVPIISKKQGSYVVKIPDFQYAGDYKITILPTTSLNDFAIDYYEPILRISRKVNIKLTALDGNDIAWFDNVYSYTSIKGIALNAQGVDWTALTETSNGYDQTWISSNSPIRSVSTNPMTYKISDVESICGYGLASGIVISKRCYSNLILPSYNDYVYDRDIFSSGYIKVNNNSSIIFSSIINSIISPKTYSELMPGFEVKNVDTQSFTVEKKGCIVTR